MAGGLQRPLTAAERAYFGRPLVGIVKAMTRASMARKQGPCTANRQDEEPTEPNDPVALVGESGMMTPFGLEPANWAIFVHCPGLESTLVSLFPMPKPVPPDHGERSGRELGRARRILKRGPDYVLTEDELPNARLQDLLVGEFTNEEPRIPDEIPSLAAPHAVEFFSSQVPEGALLTDFVDLPAVKAALAAVEKSPPLPKPTPESALVQGTPEERRKLELSAYAFLLTMHGPRSGEVVITDHTSPTGVTLDDARDLSQITPRLRASVVEDFVQKNQEAQPFPAGLKLPGAKVVLLTSKEQESFFGKHEKGWDGWREFRKVHGSTPIVTFSRVGLSRDLTQAMLYMGAQGDWLAGGGSLYILQRKGDSWEVLYELPLWVS